jgi:hypothetical protein
VNKLANDILVHAVDTVNTIDTVHAVYAIYAVGGWGRFELLPVKLSITCPKTLCSLLWGDVTLRLGHHLVANLEFADCGTSQERRVEVDVEMAGLNLISCATERSLVKTHALILLATVLRVQL